MPRSTAPAEPTSAGASPAAGPGPAGPRWQQILRDAVREPAELARLLGLADDWHRRAAIACQSFPLVAPRGFVARMRPGDPADPLLRQVLPLDTELASLPGVTSDPPFVADPLAEGLATVRPGLLQKYPGRALIVATGTCAVHCRYCFRRHFPYESVPRGLAAWEPALEGLGSDASIEEVILSGGDPLVLVDSSLAALAERLAQIPHLVRLRLHTRLPIVIPERVTDELLAWLRGTRLVPVVVVHANHPAELAPDVVAALGRFVEAGIPVLNQAVLLAGVNDSLEVLAELSRRLVAARVMPYYLHQLDRVAGAAHFHVPEQRGRQLIAELRTCLPGYAVPRYVRETAGALSKEAID